MAKQKEIDVDPEFESFLNEVIENTKRHGRSYNRVTYPNPPIKELSVPGQQGWVIAIEDGERNAYPS